MQVRSFQPGDFESLYALEELCFKPPLQFDREYMLKILTQPASINHLVVNSSGVAAFIIGSVLQKTSIRAVYIETLEVNPAHRRHGYASQLLLELEASARLRSAAQIWLHVDTANSAAIRLYERHNFILHKTIDNFYPNGGAAHLYRKNIESK